MLVYVDRGKASVYIVSVIVAMMYIGLIYLRSCKMSGSGM